MGAKIIIDPEISLSYMMHDHVDFADLREFVDRMEEETCCVSPQERVKGIIRCSLTVMRRRIAEARETFRNAHPDVKVLSLLEEDQHLDEDSLIQYFSGQIDRREMHDIEVRCRDCPECGWTFIGVGRALTGYSLLFGIDRLLNPLAVRTLHLSQQEIDDWLDRRSSRGDKRQILGHLRVCRRCRRWIRDEAGERLFKSGSIVVGSQIDKERVSACDLER